MANMPTQTFVVQY